jgi:hypothetical protein
MLGGSIKLIFLDRKAAKTLTDSNSLKITSKSNTLAAAFYIADSMSRQVFA